MDIAVLSSQKLTVLRDLIKCEADANLKAKSQERVSGFFYIEVRPGDVAQAAVLIKCIAHMHCTHSM